MLKEGVKGTQEIMVTEENTAKVMGSCHMFYIH